MSFSSLKRWLPVGIALGGVGAMVLVSLIVRNPRSQTAALTQPGCALTEDFLPPFLWGTPLADDYDLPLVNAAGCNDICVLENEGTDPTLLCLGNEDSASIEGRVVVSRVVNAAAVPPLTQIVVQAYSGTRAGWTQIRIGGVWHVLEIRRPSGGHGRRGYCTGSANGVADCQDLSNFGLCKLTYRVVNIPLIGPTAVPDGIHDPAVFYPAEEYGVDYADITTNDKVIQAQCKYNLDNNTPFPCCHQAPIPLVGYQFDNLPYDECGGISFLEDPPADVKAKYVAASCFPVLAGPPPPGPYVGVAAAPAFGIQNYNVCCDPEAGGAAPGAARCNISARSNLLKFNSDASVDRAGFGPLNGFLTVPPAVEAKKPIGKLDVTIKKTADGGSTMIVWPTDRGYTRRYLYRALYFIGTLENIRKEDPDVLRFKLPNGDNISKVMQVLAEPLDSPLTLAQYNADPRRLANITLDAGKWKIRKLTGNPRVNNQLGADVDALEEAMDDWLAVEDGIVANLVGETYEINEPANAADKQKVLETLLFPRKDAGAVAAADRLANACGAAGGAVADVDPAAAGIADVAAVQTRIDTCADMCGLVFCVFNQRDPGTQIVAPSCVRGKLTIPADILAAETADPTKVCYTGTALKRTDGAVSFLVPDYCPVPPSLPAIPASGDRTAVTRYLAAQTTLGTKIWGAKKIARSFNTLADCQTSCVSVSTFNNSSRAGGTGTQQGGGVPGGRQSGGLPGGGVPGGGIPGGGMPGGGTPGNNGGIGSTRTGANGNNSPSPPGTTGNGNGSTKTGSTGTDAPNGTHGGDFTGTSSKGSSASSTRTSTASSGASSTRTSTASSGASSTRTSTASSGASSTRTSGASSGASSTRTSSVSSGSSSSATSKSGSSDSSRSGSSSSQSSSRSSSSSSVSSGSSSSASSSSRSSSLNSSSSSTSSTFKSATSSSSSSFSFFFSSSSFGFKPFSSSSLSSVIIFLPPPPPFSSSIGFKPNSSASSSFFLPPPPPGTSSSGFRSSFAIGFSSFGTGFSSFGAFSSYTGTGFSSFGAFSSFSFSQFGFSSSACPPTICFPCTSNSQCPSNQCLNGQCVPLCGNGKVDGQEVCDDGNSGNDDACTNSCKLGTNQVCRSHDQCGTGLCLNERCTPCNTTSQCPANRLCLSRQCVDAPMCGNAIPEWTERCDDGDRDDFNSCSNKCRRGNGEACLVNRDCASLFCFNGICQACTSSDQCGGAACIDGRCEDLCGNGVINFGEQCDQGADNSDILPDRCRADCLSPRVGDGVKDSNEECDDGNTVSGDGCDRYGRLENGTPGGPLVIDLSPLTGNLNGQTSGVLPYGGSGTVIGNRPPKNTDVGPAAVIVMITGAAAGFAWMRRRVWLPS